MSVGAEKATPSIRTKGDRSGLALVGVIGVAAGASLAIGRHPVGAAVGAALLMASAYRRRRGR